MTRGPVMIMAGGTGGHIFPGLAVAEALRERERPVVWLGTRRGLEARLVPERGLEVEWISIKGLRGKGLLAWIVTPLLTLAAIWQVLSVFRRRRPAVVLGMGGFVSAPGGIAAWIVRKPLVIHEQNAVAGTANRLLAHFARRIFAGFAGAFPPAVACEVVGNPVRREILALPEPAARFAGRDGPLRLLVIGGSQGARVLNETVPLAVARLPQSNRPIIRHQAGRGADLAEEAYRAAGVDAGVEAFVDDMAAAYGWADLVVARAGALTVAELQVAGVGALLVPYPYAIDDHQTRNAESFCKNGAGVMLPEQELDAERLGSELSRLQGRRGELLRMAQAARTDAKLNAADVLATACIDLVEKAA